MSRLTQVALAMLVLSSCRSVPPAPATRINPYNVLPGKWGWRGSDDCQVAPEVVSISEREKRMYLSHFPEDENGNRQSHRESKYTILGSIPNGLILALDGEPRLDATGGPVTWNLVLRNEDEYCWRRSDWPVDHCTKPINRCEI